MISTSDSMNYEKAEPKTKRLSRKQIKQIFADAYAFERNLEEYFRVRPDPLEESRRFSASSAY